MTTEELREILAHHRLLGPAPAAEREWLIARGTVRSFAAGEVVNSKGTAVTELMVVLSGHIAIRMDRGAGAHKVFEWKGGDVGGALPFSRGARPPNDVITEEASQMLYVPGEHFPELIRDCPAITTTLVHQMLDRARQFNAADLRDEKLLSLGRLAAGMAHELNNPASAAVRSARMLADALAESELAATDLLAARLTDEQIAVLNAVRAECVSVGAPKRMTPLERADREEATTEWLAVHDANDVLAGPISETGLTPAQLDRIAASLSGPALNAALRWIAAGCLLRSLGWEIGTAASRIYDLVNSVKGFTYMDHAPTPEPVDIRRGLEDTLTMLASKTREKSAEITLTFAPDLPCAHAVGAELNQVWMNLIDNALGAIEPGGHITVTGAREKNCVVVRVTDDGSGIPAEIIGRIFDPFFTTKGVGKGTGLGLDIVRRILQRHEGQIDVESRPGRTEFRVLLPMAK